MKKTTAVLEKGTLILESGRYRRLIPGVCSIRSEAYDNGGLWKPWVRTKTRTMMMMTTMMALAAK